MDDKIRDTATGRDTASHDAGHDSSASRDRQIGDPATRPATHLPEPGPDAEPVVICAWCPNLHILKLQRREQDVVIVYWQGKEMKIIRNGVNLQISHGICATCRERLHTDRRTADQDTTL
jgi:hypothetical protein